MHIGILNLLKNQGSQWLTGEKFSQKPLGKFFGMQRQRDKSNETPISQ